MELYYEEKGRGKPFVMLHGNGEDHGYFERQTEYFSQSYRVITPDTRGHGKSPRGSGEFSIRRFSEDLSGLFDFLGIEKAVLLGFSDGGNIALRFALDHGERVEKLILNGANLFPAGVKRSVQIPIERAYERCKAKSDDEKYRKKAEILGLMVNEPDVKPEELKDLDIPTLVIAGTNDMIYKKHTKLIAESIRGAKSVFVNGDHFVARKNPDEFNEAVADFLGHSVRSQR